MTNGIEYLEIAGGLVGTLVVGFFFFMMSMARFLKRPSPSEAIIRIGRSATDVFIGRAAWIVPVLHRAATLSLSTIGLTIRRASHEALVTKDFISTNLSAEFYIRVEPAEDDVKKAARTIGIDEGHASSESIRKKAQDLLEPKLVGALRGVAAQSDFLALHVNREHFAQEVSKALREDLGRNGFTLESVTITELTQTPLSEMRADDIFGASGRQTVTNTVVEKNIAVKRKVQEEAERTAEIDREQQINVAMQDRMMREGKAREQEAAIKSELALKEALETRDLQRQSNISVEKAKKEKTEQAAAIEKEKAIEIAEVDKQKAIESAQVEKQKTVEAAQVDKQITLTMKAKESAEADASKFAAMALREKADQEVITVKRVAEAEREKRVAVVAAEQQSEQERIAADVDAYKKRLEADASAGAMRAGAEGRAEAARFEAGGAAESVKIKAQADADAAQLQSISITKLAEAHREAGLKEAEVLREKVAAQNDKSRDILLQETMLALIARAPEIIAQLVKPAERIGEIKVLQLGGVGSGAGASGNGQGGMLGSALGPMMKTILETSAMMPVLKDMMQFSGAGQLGEAMVKAISPGTPGVIEPKRAATAAGKSGIAPPLPPKAALHE